MRWRNRIGWDKISKWFRRIAGIAGACYLLLSYASGDLRFSVFDFILFGATVVFVLTSTPQRFNSYFWINTAAMLLIVGYAAYMLVTVLFLWY